jgi:uncharacterized protein YjbJ (UPF0337 family)
MEWALTQGAPSYGVRDKAIRGLRQNHTSIMQHEPQRPDSRDDDTLTDQERLDEAMMESFPASDPPSWNAGLSHEQAHFTGDALAARFPWVRNWSEARCRLKEKFGQLTDDDLLYQEGEEEDVLTRLGKKLGMSREEIESTLSTCSGD